MDWLDWLEMNELVSQIQNYCEYWCSIGHLRISQAVIDMPPQASPWFSGCIQVMNSLPSVGGQGQLGYCGWCWHAIHCSPEAPNLFFKGGKFY